MRRYLLDTGPLGAYLQGRQAVVNLVAPWLRAQEAATSILAYAEVVEYIKGVPGLYPPPYPAAKAPSPHLPLFSHLPYP